MEKDVIYLNITYIILIKKKYVYFKYIILLKRLFTLNNILYYYMYYIQYILF